MPTTDQRHNSRAIQALAPTGCSVTVARCSCGAAQVYEDKPTGGTRRAAQVLIGIFRHFHQPHGTVTVESQND
jgi:hypothetical protein